MIKKSCALKVCPICGTKAIYICERFGDGMGYGVLCKKTGCLILPAIYRSEDEARNIWNKTFNER